MITASATPGDITPGDIVWTEPEQLGTLGGWHWWAYCAPFCGAGQTRGDALADLLASADIYDALGATRQDADRVRSAVEAERQARGEAGLAERAKAKGEGEGR